MGARAISAQGEPKKSGEQAAAVVVGGIGITVTNSPEHVTFFLVDGPMSRQNLTLAERPYHHGDLQRALVRAAIEVLSESQSTDFSLRELARRAGVSHNAPYKHFADKRELLAAISAEGFELLAKRITDATKRLRNPRARLAAMGRDYVRHGVRNRLFTD